MRFDKVVSNSPSARTASYQRTCPRITNIAYWNLLALPSLSGHPI